MMLIEFQWRELEIFGEYHRGRVQLQGCRESRPMPYPNILDVPTPVITHIYGHSDCVSSSSHTI